MTDTRGAISVRLAMSIDGYIADHDGGYDWIVPVPSPGPDTAHQLPFDDFLEDVDIVVMGRRCYEQGQSEDYVTLGKRVILAPSEAAGRRDISPGIEFCDDVACAVTTAREQGQHCFVLGGGLLVHSFVAADAVDVLTVSIVPVLLGGGRSRFPGEHPIINPRLSELCSHRWQSPVGLPAPLTRPSPAAVRHSYRTPAGQSPAADSLTRA